MIIRAVSWLVRLIWGPVTDPGWYRCLVCGNVQTLNSWCARCDEEDDRGVLVVPVTEA